MARKKTIDQERILDAAERVLLERGAQHLTLDLVAQSAAISKGGLTYTFPSKEKLLAALIERDMLRTKANIDRLARDFKGEGAPEVYGLLQTARADKRSDPGKAAEILAALIHSPAALEPCRTLLKQIYGRIPSKTPAGRQARLAFLAAQGAILLNGLGLLKLSSKTRNALFDDIASLLSRKAS